MQSVIGIEAKNIILELGDFRDFLCKISPPLLIHENIYIYEEQEIASEAAGLLAEAELLEDTHQLIKTLGIAGEDFYDYGFHAGGGAFLFANDLSAFRIAGGNDIQIEMSLIQLEEHLVFKSAEETYFTVNHYTDLVMGIVKAYDVKVEFLDLDKWWEKI